MQKRGTHPLRWEIGENSNHYHITTMLRIGDVVFANNSPVVFHAFPEERGRENMAGISDYNYITTMAERCCVATHSPVKFHVFPAVRGENHGRHQGSQILHQFELTSISL